MHPDLARQPLSDEDAVRHFLFQGVREGRAAPVGPFPQGIAALIGLAEINPQFVRYLASYILLAQLKAASGDQWDRIPEILAQMRAVPGLKPFIIIGDSHSSLYNRPLIHGGQVYAPIHGLCSGGSALGLGRADSKAGYGVRILTLANEHLRPLGADLPPVFLKFGQVDVEFVWMFRRVREGAKLFSLPHFDAFADSSIASYAAFLRSLSHALPDAELKVVSIFPPTLSDRSWSKGYMNAHIGYLEGEGEIEALSEGIRTLEVPTLRYRTELHALYNHKLSRKVGSFCAFVDDFTPLIGPDGNIDPLFMQGHGGEDHHISGSAVIRPIAEVIARSC